MEKKGQVTIFIIMGIVIVSAVLVFFLWAKPTYLSEGGRKLNFENCVEDVVEQTISDLEKNAGFEDPKFTYKYNGEEFAYLCYTNEYYKTCTVQVPFLKNNFDEQMEAAIKDKVNTCYSNSISELEAQGYSVTKGEVTYDVLIEPGVVRVEIEAPTVVGSSSFAKFNVRINSPIYDMVMLSTSILQFESSYGDFDTSSAMLYYPDYIIGKIKRSDGTTLYTVENKIFGNKFQFASRSLAWPAGYAI